MTDASSGSTGERPFDTATLAQLRQWLERNPALYAQVGSIARFKVVIDANFVIADVMYRVKNPHRGGGVLTELIRSTVVEAHAPRWLETEIQKHLPLLAEEKGLELESLQQDWVQYRALLTWDEAEAAPPDNPIDCCDPKDLPYVRLAERIGAFGILSEDRHIAKMGGQKLPRDFTLSTRDYTRAVTVSVTIRTLGVTLSGVTFQALVSAVRSATRGFLALPKSVQLLLTAGLLVALVHPTSRRWLALQLQTVQKNLEPLAQTLSTIVLEARRFAEQHHLQAEQHLVVSQAFGPPPPRRRQRRVHNQPLTRKRRVRSTPSSTAVVIEGVVLSEGRSSDSSPLPVLPGPEAPAQ